MADLELLIRRLIEHQVEFVLVGGMAAVAHGVTLVTRDVDVCCRFELENLQRLHRAVADLHPVHRATTPRLPWELAGDSWRSLKDLYLSTDAGTLDCLGRIEGLGDFAEVLRWAVPIRLWGRDCHILSIDGLIKSKQSLSRTQDKLAILQLQAIKERTQGRANSGTTGKPPA
jgi:hypothetical protein